MFQLATFDYGKATVSVAPEVTFSVAGGLSCGAEQFYELPERFLEGLNGKSSIRDIQFRYSIASFDSWRVLYTSWQIVSNPIWLVV
jgi:hypothetical protein